MAVRCMEDEEKHMGSVTNGLRKRGQASPGLRVLACFLALLLVLGMSPGTAVYADDGPPTSAENTAGTLAEAPAGASADTSSDSAGGASEAENPADLDGGDSSHELAAPGDGEDSTEEESDSAPDSEAGAKAALLDAAAVASGIVPLATFTGNVIDLDDGDVLTIKDGNKFEVTGVAGEQVFDADTTITYSGADGGSITIDLQNTGDATAPVMKTLRASNANLTVTGAGSLSFYESTPAGSVTAFVERDPASPQSLLFGNAPVQVKSLTKVDAGSFSSSGATAAITVVSGDLSVSGGTVKGTLIQEDKVGVGIYVFNGNVSLSGGSIVAVGGEGGNVGNARHDVGSGYAEEFFGGGLVVMRDYSQAGQGPTDLALNAGPGQITVISGSIDAQGAGHTRSAGIMADGVLTATGSGSTVSGSIGYAGDAATNNYGIYARGMVVSAGATVYGDTENNADINSSIAIVNLEDTSAQGDADILGYGLKVTSGGQVYATGYYYSLSVVGGNGIEVDGAGSIVQSTTKDGANHSFGIIARKVLVNRQTQYDITVTNGGTVEALTEYGTGNYPALFRGITCNTLNVSGAGTTVMAYGKQYAIQTLNDVNVSGGSVTAVVPEVVNQGSSLNFSPTAIVCLGDFIASSGLVDATVETALPETINNALLTAIKVGSTGGAQKNMELSGDAVVNAAVPNALLGSCGVSVVNGDITVEDAAELTAEVEGAKPYPYLSDGKPGSAVYASGEIATSGTGNAAIVGSGPVAGVWAGRAITADRDITGTSTEAYNSDDTAVVNHAGVRSDSGGITVNGATVTGTTYQHYTTSRGAVNANGAGVTVNKVGSMNGRVVENYLTPQESIYDDRYYQPHVGKSVGVPAGKYGAYAWTQDAANNLDITASGMKAVNLNTESTVKGVRDTAADDVQNMTLNEDGNIHEVNFGVFVSGVTYFDSFEKLVKNAAGDYVGDSSGYVFPSTPSALSYSVQGKLPASLAGWQSLVITDDAPTGTKFSGDPTVYLRDSSGQNPVALTAGVTAAHTDGKATVVLDLATAAPALAAGSVLEVRFELVDDGDAGTQMANPIVNTAKFWLNETDPSALPSDPDEEATISNKVVRPADSFEKLVFDGADYVDNYTFDHVPTSLSYAIDLAAPSDLAGWNRLVVNDEAPAGTKFNAVAVEVGGVPVAGAVASISSDGLTARVSIPIDAGNQAAIEGATVRVIVDLAVEDATVLGNPIVNEAAYYLNPSDSDVPPDPDDPIDPSVDPDGEGDIETPIAKPIDNFEKLVFDGAGYADSYTFEQTPTLGSFIEYAIQFEMPDSFAGYDKLTLVDDLPTGTTVEDSDFASLYNVSDGSEVTSGVSVAHNLTKTVVRLDVTDFTGLEGKTLQMRVKVKVAGTLDNPVVNEGRWWLNPADPGPGDDPADPPVEPEDGKTTIENDRRLTVIFDGNGADVEADPGSIGGIVKGSTVGTMPQSPEREGFAFMGWNSHPAGEGDTFDATVPVHEDRTVYAQWLANYYTLAFDVNGGSSTPPSNQLLKMGDSATEVDDPVREGYVFEGWYTESQNGNEVDLASFTMPAHDVTLYAHWSKSVENIFSKDSDTNQVRPGSTTYYTIAGFGNDQGVALDAFTVRDRPSAGLSFTYADMPALKNGSSVTYGVYYTTDQNGKRLLADGLSAASPHRIDAPRLASGERITEVSFEFGTVPADFALEGVITLAFRVWDNPPSSTVRNEAVWSFEKGGAPTEKTTDVTQEVIRSAAPSALIRTGDTPMVLFAAGAVVLAVAVLVLAGTVRRRRKNGSQ